MNKEMICALYESTIENNMVISKRYFGTASSIAEYINRKSGHKIASKTSILKRNGKTCRSFSKNDVVIWGIYLDDDEEKYYESYYYEHKNEINDDNLLDCNEEISHDFKSYIEIMITNFQVCYIAKINKD